MHISDGFLDVKTSAATAGLAVAGLALALREVRRFLPPRKMPLLGLAAAFIFAAQMLNFPVAAWCSTVLTAGFCALELAFSGAASFRLVVPAMVGIHAAIGVIEAVITTLVMRAVVSGENVWQPESGARLDSRTGFALALLVSFALALFVAPFACDWPDGLESVAERLGFSGRASVAPVAAPLTDYTVPGLGQAGLATAVAGTIGTAAAFILFWGLFKMMRKSRRRTPPASEAR